MSGGLVFVGVLALIDFLLILLLARRVLPLTRSPGPARRPWLAPGAAVPDFETVTIAGEPVSLSRLSGRQSLVGLFSPGCAPCQEQAPAFAAHAAGVVAPGQALAVVVGAAEDFSELLALLGDGVLVAREDRSGPTVTAFAARGFPAMYLLSAEGTVVASGATIAAVSGAHRAAAATRR